MNNNSTEIRIANLENENKARKASSPVASSLVSFQSSQSDVFSAVGGQNVNLVVRIKFTPDIVSKTGFTFVNIAPIVSANSDFSYQYSKVRYYCEPQSGDGSIVLRVVIITVYEQTRYYIKAVSTGSTTGSFNLL